MTITTSKNKTYQVKWIDSPIQDAGMLALMMEDARPLLEIAAEFNGLTEIKRKDAHQGDKTFTGFDRLIGIKRVGNDVMIQMEATR